MIVSESQLALQAEKSDLIQSQKQLVETKRQLSRKIGQLKNDGQSCDLLIEEMKLNSKELKTVNSRLAEIESLDSKIDLEEGDSDFPVSLPNHFDRPEYSLVTAPQDLTVQHLTGSELKHKWNSFVGRELHGCVYHRFEFKNIIERSFGHETIYLMATDSDDEVQGILPAVHTRSRLFGNYITSLPFFNYGGPLATSQFVEESLIQSLANAAISRGASHVEIRETHTREGYPARTDKVSMYLSLPNSADLLWKRIGSKLRAQINKGKSHDLVFKIGGVELLEDFYKVFSHNMRDLGTPVYAKSFFLEILQQKKLDSTLALLYHQNKPVSCAFLLGFNDTLEIPWASTLRKANSLNANMVLYWHVLEYSVYRGFQYFDFGRSSTDASTYKFKKQWGAQPVPLYWHYWLSEGVSVPQINPNNPKYSFAISAWQRLPVVIANLLGPYLVRNLP